MIRDWIVKHPSGRAEFTHDRAWGTSTAEKPSPRVRRGARLLNDKRGYSDKGTIGSRTFQMEQLQQSWRVNQIHMLIPQ
jgi:hypothetical protein